MGDSYESLDELLNKKKDKSLGKKLKELKERYWENIVVGSVVGGIIVAYPILAAGIGAVIGEILDHAPYFNEAIPRTIEALTGSKYFYGNLDKLGAMLGFVGTFFRSSCNYKKSEY